MIWLLTTACAIAVGLALYDLMRARPLAWAFVVPKIDPHPSDPYFDCIFHYESQAGCAHASTFAGQGLIWFDGSREAAEDVKIRHADLTTGQITGHISDWFDAPALTRAIQPRQTVRVLGNTIALPGNSESPHDTGFITTTVSIGGWAGSSLALGRYSQDAPLRAQRLYTHNYSNRSHLVRSPAVMLAGGDMLIPAYFEARMSVGEMIRLRPDGTMVWKARLGQGRQLIQPCIHILDSRRAFALCRGVDAHHRLYRSDTVDGGKTWSRPYLTDLPCPNAPVALAPLSGGRIVMAHNPDPDHCNRLHVSASDDEGQTWHLIHEFAAGKAGLPDGSLRYPALQADGMGGLRLSFTAKNKGAVVAYAFNEQWMAAQI